MRVTRLAVVLTGVALVACGGHEARNLAQSAVGPTLTEGSGFLAGASATATLLVKSALEYKGRIGALNVAPDAVFVIHPYAVGTRVRGFAPLEVTVNGCKTADADPGDLLKFTYDWEGKGAVERNICRATHTYTEGGVYRLTACTTDRVPDHETCQTWTVEVRERASGSTGPSSLCSPNGIYWVGIQVNQDYATHGQHFWSNRTVMSNNESVWVNPGDGFGSGCTTFTPQTTCGVGGGTNPDFLYTIDTYTQTDNASGNGAPDQNFEATYDVYDSMGADDFSAPAGATLTQVTTVGTTGGIGGSTVNVTIYTDNAGTPGGVACAYSNLATSNSANLNVTLPSACALACP